MVKNLNMKKLLNKINIHPLTLIILIILLHEGLIKYVFTIFLIILIHEIGHIFFILTFKRKIKTITFLPFGGLIKIDSDLSTNIYEDLLISIGGIFFQLLLYFITDNQLILFYNKLIIIFNLIPICPLDGYRIVKLILELFMPYKKTFLYSFITSISLIVIIIIININVIYSNLLIFLFMMIKSIKEFKFTKYYMSSFYMERMVRYFKFKSIINISKKEDMYKNKTNIIKGKRENIYLRDEYLK